MRIGIVRRGPERGRRLHALRPLRLLPAVAASVFLGCLEDATSIGREPGADPALLPEVPVGFPALPYPEGNPPTAARIALGRRLFFDTDLSRNRTVSCASCHQARYAFSDSGRALSPGVDGRSVPRNAPSLTNVAYGTSFFAAGGVPTLELQAIAPFLNPLEMDIHTDTVAARVAGKRLYRDIFIAAFGDDSVSFPRITKAIASFERALISGDAPFDRWSRGEREALTPSALRGMELFFGERGDCFHCHGGFNFTDQGFHNTGLDPATTDPGRIEVTGRALDDGKFKTPTLRNIAVTGPYMHDGRFTTLRESVAHYNRGGKAHPNKDPLMRPLGLSDPETEDLVAFLESLTDSTFLTNPEFTDPWSPR